MAAVCGRERHDDVVKGPAPAAALGEEEGEVGRSVAVEVPGRDIAEVLRHDLRGRAGRGLGLCAAVNERHRLTLNDEGRDRLSPRIQPVPRPARDKDEGHAYPDTGGCFHTLNRAGDVGVDGEEGEEEGDGEGAGEEANGAGEKKTARHPEED